MKMNEISRLTEKEILSLKVGDKVMYYPLWPLIEKEDINLEEGFIVGIIETRKVINRQVLASDIFYSPVGNIQWKNFFGKTQTKNAGSRKIFSKQINFIKNIFSGFTFMIFSRH